MHLGVLEEKMMRIRDEHSGRKKCLQAAKDKNRVLQRLQGARDDKVVISPLSNQNKLQKRSPDQQLPGEEGIQPLRKRELNLPS